MATRRVETKIRLGRLIVAPPDVVAKELAEYEASGDWDGDLETALLARNDPFINLSLARCCQDRDVFQTLYDMSKDSTALPKPEIRDALRLSCLSNQWRGLLDESDLPRGEFNRIIKDGADDETEALLTNPSLSPFTLASLFEKSEPFSSLDEARLAKLISFATENPRITTEEDWVDEPDMGLYEIQEGIFRLLGWAPTTLDWVRVLRRLVNKLNPGQVHTPDEPIDHILARWMIAKSEKNPERRAGLYTPTSRYARLFGEVETELSPSEEFRCLVASLYGEYRSGDGSGYGISGASDSSDIARRCAFYGNAKLTKAEMQEGFDKDDEVYLLSVLNNMHIYWNEDLRRLLEEKHLRGFALRIYKNRLEQMRQARVRLKLGPLTDWLKEDEELFPQSEDEALRSRVNSALSKTERALTSLKEQLDWWLILLMLIALLAIWEALAQRT